MAAPFGTTTFEPMKTYHKDKNGFLISKYRLKNF